MIDFNRPISPTNSPGPKVVRTFLEADTETVPLMMKNIVIEASPSRIITSPLPQL